MLGGGRFLWGAIALSACAPPKASELPSARPTAAVAPAASAAAAPLPPHLETFPGLFVRKGDQIVAAPETDVSVARGYARSAEKGALLDGHRLTVLAAKRTYRVGEEVRVLHVHEVAVEGEQVFPMGPKPVRGEFVDGKMVTATVLADVDPFQPEVYDGAVLASPAVDYNWDITSYRFTAPGTRTIQWRVGRFASNVLSLEIVP